MAKLWFLEALHNQLSWLRAKFCQPLQIDFWLTFWLVATRQLLLFETEPLNKVWVAAVAGLLLWPVVFFLFNRLTHLIPAFLSRPTLIGNLLMLAFMAVVTGYLSYLLEVAFAPEVYFPLQFQIGGGALLIPMVYVTKIQVAELTTEYRLLRQSEELLKARIQQLRLEATSLVESMARLSKRETYEAFRRQVEVLRSVSTIKVPAEINRQISLIRDGSVRDRAKKLVLEIADWELLLKPATVTNPLRLPASFDLALSIRPDIIAWLTPALVIGKVLSDGVYEVPKAVFFGILQVLAWELVRKTAQGRVMSQLKGVATLLTLSIFVPFVVALPTVLVFGNPSPFDSFFTTFIGYLQLSPFFILSIAYLMIIRQSLEASHRALSSLKSQLEIQKRQIDLRVNVMRRQFGYFLHGTIQALLNAAAMRLEAAGYSEFAWANFQVELAEIDQQLLGYRPSSIDLWEQVEKLQSVWRGLAEVKVMATDEAKAALATEPSLAFSVNEIWREAVGNAIRHGQARHIEISHAVQGGVLAVAVKNDGAAPTLGAQTSLGLALLDDLTLEWWFEVDDAKPLPVCLELRFILRPDR